MIQDVGFPIVCVIGLGYYCNSMTKTLSEFKEVIVKFDSKLDTLIDVKKED